MRVLLDATAVPMHPVGAGVYVLHLATGLGARDDLELHLLTRRNDGGRWRHYVPGATIHDLVPSTRPGRLLWEQRFGPGLARELDVDVWHGPHYTMPYCIDVPSVVTVHDLTFFDHPEWHERTKVAFFGRVIRHTARHADAIIAVSRYTADGLSRFHPDGRVLVAPHGVDHDRFRPGVRGDYQDLERLETIGVRPPFLAFAGTMEPRKNVPGLVDAFAALAPRTPDLGLVLAGADGWGTDAVRDAVARSGATTRILRPGYIPSSVLAPLYRQAEVIVYPSFDEGFGLPVIEALACGAAVVTTTGSAMQEVAGDSAYLVPPGDVGAIVDALVELSEDPDTLDALRAAGPVRAAEFTWAASVDRHVEAYHAVAR